MACANFDELERNKPYTLTVTIFDTYHFDGGTLGIAPSTDLGVVSLYVDNPDHGWSVIHGTWLDAGVALLEEVPPGFTYVVRPDDPLFFSISSDARTVDLGTDFVGPPNGLGLMGTVANFSLLGGVTPDANTMVVARIPDFALTEDNILGFAPPSFAPFKQAAQGAYVFAHDWSQLPLLAHQTVELLELPAQTLDGGALLWSPAKYGSTAATLSDAVPTTVNVAMSDLPAGAVPEDSFDIGALAQAMSVGVPDAGAVSVWARTLLSTGDAFSALTAQALYLPAPPSRITIPALQVNPLPDEAWQPLLQAQVFVTSSISLGTSTQTSLLSASTTGPMGDEGWKANSLGPVTNLVVDNSSGLLAPTLTWSAPATGSAQYFAIAVLELDVAASGELTSTAIDYYVVFGNRCPIRPDVLQPDVAYVFLVEAVDCGETLQGSPLRTASGPTCTNAFNRTLVYLPVSD